MVDEREKVQHGRLCSCSQTAMAFLFQRPSVAHSSAPAFHDEDTPGQDIVRISDKVWSALLLSPEETATLSISRVGSKHAGYPGLPSITCRGVLDPNVSVQVSELPLQHAQT